MPGAPTWDRSWFPDLDALGPRLPGRKIFLPRANDTLVNPPWGEAGPRILILRLSPWDDVAESLTHHHLFGLVREVMPEALVDLAFMPDQRDRRVLDAPPSGVPIPWPLGLATGYPLGSFDSILVSAAYVLEALNVLPILRAHLSNPLARLRGPADPLVILGGSSAPVFSAVRDLVDAFYFGEFEQGLEGWERVLSYRRGSTEGTAREWLTPRVTTVPGLWVPESPAPGLAWKRPAPSRASGGQRAYPVLNNGQAQTVRLRINQGCPYRCSFCFEGHTRKPHREGELSPLVQDMASLRTRTGAKSLDVVSFNFNTHPQILSLIEAGALLFPHIHLMSQRMDQLQRDPVLLEAETAIGKRSFTLGIEGISPRMRQVFRKDLADEDLEGILDRLASLAVRELKLFYIWSGLETSEDLDDFSAFLGRLRARQEHRRFRVVLSFGLLMVMPFTPLQALELRYADEMDPRALDALEALVLSHGFEFRFSLDRAQHSLAQVLLMVPPDQGLDLLRAAEARGVFFDSLQEGSASALLPRPDDRPRGGPSFDPPFGFLLDGDDRARLQREWRRATDWIEDRGDTAQPPRSGEARKREGASLSRLKDIMTWKRTRVHGRARVWIPRDLAGAGPDWLGSWLVRRVLEADPSLVPVLCRVDLDAVHRENLMNCEQWYGESWWTVEAHQPAGLEKAMTILASLPRNPSDAPWGREAHRVPRYTWALGEKAAPAAMEALVFRVLAASHSALSMEKTPQGRIWSGPETHGHALGRVELVYQDGSWHLGVQSREAWAPRIMEKELERSGFYSPTGSWGI